MADLSLKRRRLLAVAAIGALGAGAVATGASAQTTSGVPTSQKPITATVNVVGPVPPGVTGFNVDVYCKNVTGAISADPNQPPRQNLTAAYGLTGGTAALNFGLKPNVFVTLANGTIAKVDGSSCIFVVRVQGTANLSSQAIQIKVGGNEIVPFTVGRVVSNGAVTYDANSTTAAIISYDRDFGYIPVFDSTDAVINIVYPQITVKKDVKGDEPITGYAYPMVLSCANPSTGVAFLVGINGYVVPTDFNAITYADLANIKVFVAQAGTVTGVLGVYSDGGNFYLGAAASAVDQAAAIARMKDFVTTVSKLVPQYTTRVRPVIEVDPTALFDGSFTLKGGASRTFGVAEYPALNGLSRCVARETNSNGSALSYESTNGTFLNGIARPTLLGETVNGVYASALTSMGQTITVTNSFLGDLIISKIVSGDPKTNIATYEISVACDKSGPKDTFLLKDRQSKVYTNLLAGTNCLVTETRSDGATPTYSDNSGDNGTDGRVVVKRSADGCAAPGAPTPAIPGGGQPTIFTPPVSLVGTFNSCTANVIVTNTYGVVATTAAAVAPAPTAAPATTAAPAVSAAPATPVVETPTFTG